MFQDKAKAPSQQLSIGANKGVAGEKDTGLGAKVGSEIQPCRHVSVGKKRNLSELEPLYL